MAQRFNADDSNHSGSTTACACGRRARYAGRRSFRAKGLCVSSGVVEAGCKQIGDRLKRAGMRWTVAGANAHHRPAPLHPQRTLRGLLGATSRKCRLTLISQCCRAPMAVE